MAGLAVDSDNRAYVSQSVGDKVQIFGADGAYLGAWGGSGSDPGEFFNPQGIVVDGEGNAYVSDFGNERIQKFRLNVPAAAAGPASVVATLIETRVPNMPGGLITIMVDHWFFPTEPSTLRFPEQGGGPTIVVSEAEGFVASVAGDEQRLLPGRALLIPREGSLRKSGSAAESAYSVGFVEAPANGQHDPGIYAENSVEAMTDVIPAGAADVVLERITLAAGSNLSGLPGVRPGVDRQRAGQSGRDVDRRREIGVDERQGAAGLAALLGAATRHRAGRSCCGTPAMSRWRSTGCG